MPRMIEQPKGQIRVCPRDGEHLEVQGIVGNTDGISWTVYMVCGTCGREYMEHSELAGEGGE